MPLNSLCLQINKFIILKREIYFANRLLGKSEKGFSDPIIRIAITAVALSIAVMILSVAIVTGFQREIREKVIGFGGHIQISSFTSNNSYEPEPVSSHQPSIEKLKDIPGISHVQVMATKPCLIRTEHNIQGVVLKGIDRDFNWDYIGEVLSAGTIIRFNDTAASNEILVSKKNSLLLGLKPGDEVRTYFIIDNLIRARKFVVAGIFDTGLEEFDKLFVYADIRHIQRLNNWDPDQVAGFEVYIDKFANLDKITTLIYREVGSELNAQSVRELYPQIFDWLRLQDMNVVIILTLMLLVAIITILSALLITILERTNHIGVFKALGYDNLHIRKVFILIAARITLKGLVWGNIIGLGLSMLQQHFGIIELNQESYYVSVVPIGVDWLHVVLLNAGVLIVSVLAMVLPSLVITSITPVKAIRFD